jgi:hypothetical protein
MKTVLCILLISCLAGCTSLSERAASWQDKNINDMIASWGAPSQVMDNGEYGKMYVWRFNGQFTTMGTARTTYNYYGSYTTYSPGQTYNISRSVTVWANKNGTIYRTAAR